MASEEDSLRHRGRKNGDLTDQNGQKLSNTTQISGKVLQSTDMNNKLQNFSNGAPRGSPQSVKGSTQQPRHYRTAHEHAMAVQQWLWQCQLWHSMNWAYMTSFPMYAASMMSFQQWNQNQNLQNGGVPGVGPMTGVGGAATAGPAQPGVVGMGRNAQPMADQGEPINADIGELLVEALIL